MSAGSNGVDEADAKREAQIDAAYARMMAAASREEQSKHFFDMASLIRDRSPQQILKIERERRIARRGA